MAKTNSAKSQVDTTLQGLALREQVDLLNRLLAARKMSAYMLDLCRQHRAGARRGSDQMLTQEACYGVETKQMQLAK